MSVNSRPDPHSYYCETDATIEFMEISWYINFERKVISASVRIDLDRPCGGMIDLDTRDLDIKTVIANGECQYWQMGDKDPILGSKMRIYLPVDASFIIINYETSPTSTALQWLLPKQTFGKVHPYVYSQCQAIHARSIVPCQDTPGVRFRYKAWVTLPNSYLKPIMSAELKHFEFSLENGEITYGFEMDNPIPSYLLTIEVGAIETRDTGPRCRIYGAKEKISEAVWEFARMEEMLKVGEALFGPYLWGRFVVAVQEVCFPYGGMENPLAIFVSPTIICGDRSQVFVLYHELAHFWWGNLVTNRTWQDFWLNEGLTTYGERRFVEAMEGADVAELHWAVGARNLKNAFEEFKDKPELTCLHIANMNDVDPDVVFSSVPYEKGAQFFRLLEQTAGKEVLDAFLREYAETYKFKSIDTVDFLEFLERHLPGICDQVNAKQWIYEPGLPVNAPKIHSVKLDRLESLATNWPSFNPVEGETANWSPQEWVIFIEKLPKLSYADCVWLDNAFDLSNAKNLDVLISWYPKAIAAGYTPVLPKIRNVVGSVGRMGSLKELYKGLIKADQKILAKQWYDECSHLYHPAARAFLKPLFDE